MARECVQAAEVDPVGQQRQLEDRSAELDQRLPLRLLEGDALGVVRGLEEEGIDEVVHRLELRGRECCRDLLAIQLAGRRLLDLLGRQQRLADLVHQYRTDMEAVRGEFRMRVGRLLDWHLLEQGDEVHGCRWRFQKPGDRYRVSVDRPHPSQSGDFGVDVEEPADSAGRRRVENHGVVDVLPFLVPPAGGLVRLAGQEYVPHPGRDGRREVDRADTVERAARPAELVEQIEVFEQRLLRVHGQPEDLPSARCDCDLAFLVGQRRHVEQLGNPLPTLHLAEEGAVSLGREGDGKSRGHRRLAGAALPADYVEPCAHRSHATWRTSWPVEQPGARGPSGGAWRRAAAALDRLPAMAKWEYATVPLLVHATKQILDTWGEDGWELVQVVPGPSQEQLVAYMKRERP